MGKIWIWDGTRRISGYDWNVMQEVVENVLTGHRHDGADARKVQHSDLDNVLPDQHHAVHVKTLADHPLTIIPVMDDAHIPDVETLSYTNPFAVAQIPDLLRSKITDFWSAPFWANIPDKPSTYPPDPHDHVRTEVIDFWDTPFWANIPDKPSTFPPSNHSYHPSLSIASPSALTITAGGEIIFGLAQDVNLKHIDIGEALYTDDDFVCAGSLDYWGSLLQGGIQGIPTSDIRNDAVTVDKLAHNIDAQPIGFNADKVDGKHASDFSAGAEMDNITSDFTTISTTWVDTPLSIARTSKSGNLVLGIATLTVRHTSAIECHAQLVMDTSTPSGSAHYGTTANEIGCITLHGVVAGTGASQTHKVQVKASGTTAQMELKADLPSADRSSTLRIIELAVV